MPVLESTATPEELCSQVTSPPIQVAEAMSAAQLEQEDCYLGDWIALQTVLWAFLIMALMTLSNLLRSVFLH